MLSARNVNVKIDFIGKHNFFLARNLHFFLLLFDVERQSNVNDTRTELLKKKCSLDYYPIGSVSFQYKFIPDNW